MRILPLMIAVALSASLAACAGAPSSSGDGNTGGGTSDGGGGSDDSTTLPDPCALVTKAEVETAVGGTVADGVEPDPGPNHYAFGLGRQCAFVPDNKLNSPAFITVFTYSADGWDQYKENQASFSTFHEVTGIGEEAISAGDTQVGIHQGDLVLDLQVTYDTAHDPAGEPRMLELARIALGRL